MPAHGPPKRGRFSAILAGFQVWKFIHKCLFISGNLFILLKIWVRLYHLSCVRCENSGPDVCSTFRHLYIQHWLLKGLGGTLKANPLCSSSWWCQIGGAEWVENYNDGKHGPRILCQCNLAGDLLLESKPTFSLILSSDFGFFRIFVTQRFFSLNVYFCTSFDTSVIIWLWYVKKTVTATAVRRDLQSSIKLRHDVAVLLVSDHISPVHSDIFEYSDKPSVFHIIL